MTKNQKIRAFQGLALGLSGVKFKEQSDALLALCTLMGCGLVQLKTADKTQAIYSLQIGQSMEEFALTTVETK